MNLLPLLVALMLLAQGASAQTYPQKFGSDSMLPTYPKGSELEFSMPPMPDWKPCRGCLVVYQSQERGGPTLYTHRILALGGDEVRYDDVTRRFEINGAVLGAEGEKPLEYLVDGQPTKTTTFVESNGDRRYAVISASDEFPLARMATYMFKNEGAYPALTKAACTFQDKAFNCKVPASNVFVIGDNRGWTLFGFVPTANIVGHEPRIQVGRR